MVLPDKLHGPLIVFSYQYFGPRPHCKKPVFFVEPKFKHCLGLFHYFFVDQGQKSRVINRRILNQDQDTDLGILGIKINIEAIFRAFD